MEFVCAAAEHPQSVIEEIKRREPFDVIKVFLRQVISRASWIKSGIWGLLFFSCIALGVIAAGLFGFAPRTLYFEIGASVFFIVLFRFGDTSFHGK